MALAFAAAIPVASAQSQQRPAFAEPLPTPAGALDLRIPVNNRQRQVAATLYLPEGSGPFPIAIAAGGASQASRNAGRWPMIAKQLSSVGYGLLVHDPPGTGDTQGEWRETVPLRDAVDELTSIAAYLNKHPKVQPDRIGVIGWSRGGWTGPLAAVESPHINFVVANSAPSVSPNSANIHQRGEELLDEGYSSAEVAEINALRQIVWDYYGTGRNYEKARTAWTAASARPWFKRLGWRAEVQPPDALYAANFEYYREGTYDPAPALARLTEPTLVILGTADRHIPVADSIVGWQAGFDASDNPDATLVLLANAGHALKLVEGRERMSAAEGHSAFSNLRDHPQYIPILLDWLRRHR